MDNDPPRSNRKRRRQDAQPPEETKISPAATGRHSNAPHGGESEALANLLQPVIRQQHDPVFNRLASSSQSRQQQQSRALSHLSMDTDAIRSLLGNSNAAGSSYSSSAIQDQLLQNALLNHAMRHSSLALPSSLHQRGDPFLSSITNTNTGTSGLGGLDILRGRAAGTAAPSILRHQLLAAAASQAQAHPRSSLGNTTALQQATALLRNNSVTNEQTRRQELQRILSENAQGLRRGQESGYLQRSNAQQRLLLDSQISQQLVGGLSVGYLQQILGRQTTPQMPSAAAANSARLSAMPSQPNHQLPGPGARAAAFVRSAYAERPTREPVTLYLSCDDDSLTPYQCLARKQIQLFECTAKDVDSASSSGRSRRGVRVGQVGIRCRHCSHLPQRERARGSTYYPTKLEGIYQAAQNMANSHLTYFCQSIPQYIRDELLKLGNKKSSAGGGRDYWSGGAKTLGIVEDEYGLRFKR